MFKGHLKRLFVLTVTVCSSLAIAQQDVVPGEYLIKFKDQTGPAGVMGKIQGKASLKSSFAAIGIYQISLKNQNETSTISDLLKDPSVEYIEPNFVLQKVQVGEPESIVDAATLSAEVAQQSAQQSNDVTALAGPSPTPSFTQNYSDVQVTQSWAAETAAGSGTRPIVAIVDTGIDATHSVFTGSNALWVNSREIANNGVDDDLNGYVDDIYGWNFINNTNAPIDGDGHGTHVAGIVLGVGQNIFQASLDQAKVQIMPLKFLDDTGSGSTSNAINAIYYAVNNGAKVINNSWGGSSYSRALHDALTFAYNRHVLIVTAAGNQSHSNDSSPIYPANYDVPSNLSVAASTDSDALAYFSNYGSGTVWIASPGDSIQSTYPGNRYARMSGTSMAAPFVAGLAALAIREQTSLTGYQTKNLLASSADVSSLLSGYTRYSSRVNAYKAISAAKNAMFVASLSADPGYSPTYLAERSTASESSSKVGCGSVTASALKNGPKNGDFSTISVMAGLFAIPMLIAMAMRRREGRDARRFERFKMESKIKVQVGDHELVADMKTISMGGLSFNAEEALEKGGLVTLKIASPDGTDMLEVQGHVVWNREGNTYGVAFDKGREGVGEAIAGWSRNLLKADG